MEEVLRNEGSKLENGQRKLLRFTIVLGAGSWSCLDMPISSPTAACMKGYLVFNTGLEAGI